MMRRRFGSLGRRLSYWLALQNLAVLTVMCAAVYALIQLDFRSRQLESLGQKQTQLLHVLTEAAREDDTAAVAHQLDDFFIGHPEMGLSITRADGSSFYRRSAPSDNDRVRASRFAWPNPEPQGGSLDGVLTLDIGGDIALLKSIGFTLAMAALVGTLLSSLSGFTLVRWGLRPLHHLVDQTRRLAADTLHRRLDGSAQPEELEPLVTQFNDLLARLSLAYTQLEGFNADVAHELCTPLATLIGSNELALRKGRDARELREVLGSNLEELERLAGIVHDMLFLSHADRGASARRSKVPSLAALARQVSDYHEAALAEAGLHLEVSGDAGGEFDAALLQRALSNLVGNATRHATHGSTVDIKISARSDGEIALCVVNRGETVAADSVPRLFDRFYRGDPSRSDGKQHHGLGLSIVAAIARMHGGRPLATSSQGVTSIGFTLRGLATVAMVETDARSRGHMHGA